MVDKGEVHDTSLVKRAVFTDHQPVQGVALSVGGFVYHLLKSWSRVLRRETSVLFG